MDLMKKKFVQIHLKTPHFLKILRNPKSLKLIIKDLFNINDSVNSNYFHLKKGINWIICAEKLDVKSVSFIIEKLKNLKKTIFLTSHDTRVVEKLCDRIAFINKGSILKIGTREDISKFEHTKIGIEIKINTNKGELKRELDKQSFISEIIDFNQGTIINLKERKFYKELLSILKNYEITFLKENELSLEDLFLKII